MRQYWIQSLVAIALVGCGHIPPSAHKEVSQSDQAYIAKKELPANTNRLYLCQGKRYTKAAWGEGSESWTQARNTQLNLYDGATKLAILNDDEVAVMDFSKQKILRFEWRFEITDAKIGEGEIKLDPANSIYSSATKIASQKIDRVFTVTDSGTVIAAGGSVFSFGGQYGYTYPAPISTGEKFCENKRIVFFNKLN
jgi:hypothetical protein